jgi:hypothetical protein
MAEKMPQAERFHMPLLPGDSPLQTVGCRHTNPDICSKNSECSLRLRPQRWSVRFTSKVMAGSVRSAAANARHLMLPDGWRYSTFEEFCTYYKGGTPFEKLEYSVAGLPVLAKGISSPLGD